ncbi:single-stranded DNA-binding protein [archaeon]|nr:single-stranded DNA-binding protein [archaeon]
MSYSKTIILGNVGKDPDILTVTNGIKASFSVATQESYMKDGEKKQVTQWHRLIAWGKTAETIQKYVKKGMRVLVDGMIQYRSFENKDGNKVYVTEIRVNNFTMLGEPKSKPADSTPEPTEDVPF